MTPLLAERAGHSARQLRDLGMVALRMIGKKPEGPEYRADIEGLLSVVRLSLMGLHAMTLPRIMREEAEVPMGIGPEHEGGNKEVSG